ncbi:ankyrin [Cadophora sp. DSE1049]|nr:ankyrin [Cadophora sp. DSE1049]
MSNTRMRQQWKLEDKSTLSHSAVRTQNLTLARIMQSATLARIGFDTNVAANALVAAAYIGDLSIIQKLLERGLDINKRQRWFATPLEQSCSHGHYDVVEFLLENGADFAKKSFPCRNAPLDAAYAAGHEKIMHLLLNHKRGLGPKMYGGIRDSAIKCATTGGHFSILRYLFPPTKKYMFRSSVSISDIFEHRSLFSKAVSYGREDILRWLLEEFTEVTFKDHCWEYCGVVLVRKAIQKRRHGIVKVLVGYGTARYVNAMVEIAKIGDVEVANAFFDTQGSPFKEYTVLNGTKRDRREIPNLKVNVEGRIKLDYCSVPLLHAVNKRNYDMIQWLIRRGAKIPSWIKGHVFRDSLNTDERLLQALSLGSEGVMSGLSTLLVCAVLVIVYVMYWCRVQDSRYAPPTI